MAKNRSVFVCGECGYESGKWLGKCPECESWNSFSEEILKVAPKGAPKAIAKIAPLRRMADVQADDRGERIQTGLVELDRVLGGGLVKGSAVLIGGDPGIGKSTLLLQACERLSRSHKVVYVSGEESAAQLKLRAQRLELESGEIRVLCETELERIQQTVRDFGAGIIVIDSVQTMVSEEASGTSGSVSQVRNATASLTQLAKESGAAVFIVGHVTKQGAIAGPRVLEHLVDTVLYFEGDRYESYRILRAVKNRFGSTNEIGVFEMGERGMAEVPNPSALFLSERSEPLPGCSIVCTMEGTRTLLAEVQALCSTTRFGTPRRTSAGIDYNRMALLCAVLEKKLGLRLAEQDIYVNVVGGLRIHERCADLAVVAAIVSSLQDCSLAPGTVAVGEVGLTGEVRGATQAEKRAAECARLGFSRIVMPAHNARGIKVSGIEIVGADSLEQAVRALLR